MNNWAESLNLTDSKVKAIIIKGPDVVVHVVAAVVVVVLEVVINAAVIFFSLLYIVRV